ncbi:MAG: ATP-binding protein [Bauldia sp.]
MDGRTSAYLDLAADEAVGGLLLDARPAFLFSGEGTRVPWANVAGAAFLGERRIGDLVERRFSGLNPIRAQIARLARLLPSDRQRLEILRFGFGVQVTALVAACRRLHRGDGTSAVLAIGANGGATESLGTRAENLAEAVAGDDAVAAIFDTAGKILGASRGFADIAPTSRDIDALTRMLAQSGDRRFDRPVRVGGVERRASAVRFQADGRALYLVAVGTAASATAIEVPSDTPAAVVKPAAATVEANPPQPQTEAIADAPAATSEPAVRFVWRTDGDKRFTFVSPELAAAVGTGNATVLGKTWEAIADVLDLDPDGSVASGLAGKASFAATVYWPTEDSGDRIAVDLSAARDPAGGGFVGFGACRPGERRADDRAKPTSLTKAAPVEAPPAVASQPASEEPARPPAEAAAGEDDLDDAARRSIEQGLPAGARNGPPARSLEPAGRAAAAPSNVIRLPGAEPRQPPAGHLTGTEEDAFRRIAEALADGAEEAGAGRRRPPEAEKPAPPAEIDVRLLDRLPVGLVVFRDTRALFANSTLLDLLGYDSFAGFVAGGGVETLFPERAGGFSGEGPRAAGGRLAARRRDGRTIPVEVRLNTVRWGPASALMLAISPVGGRTDKGPADELAAAEAKLGQLDAILNTATDGVIVVDRQGRIGSMNRAAEALFGVGAASLVGHRFTELLAEESHKPALDYLDGLAANGVASVLNDGREVIGKVPQGGLIPLFMTMGRIGGSETFCAVLRDITHWKNVEEELTAARHAAEAANAQKSNFLAKISHEIRTPLTAIIGFSEMMIEERFGPIGNERYRSYLSDIHLSGSHLMSLINDLLDLSKVEAGKLDLAFESVAVNAVIQECVALMQPQANRERIIIRTSLTPDAPSVVADPRSFRQILLNLLSNAIKFTGAGGQVIVSTALEESGEAVVRVRDTGIGMSEKDIEMAMRPFEQVAKGKDGRDKGTGLGLPLTKALVEANRASFAIESGVDQGTLVRITFPTTRVLTG